MVVVPTMLSNAEAVADLLEGLEVRYLANRDDNLHFALLTDLAGCAARSHGRRTRNWCGWREKASSSSTRSTRVIGADIFFLFHRPRRWNAQEGVWMGYERKRGKLAEFNALLRESRRTRCRRANGTRMCLYLVDGDTNVLPEVRYVITLDTDTQLPRDSAREMVGAMAHPLNRPVFDAERRRVVAGYGICSRASA